MTAIAEIAERHGLAVVEDAAQGLGATWRGRPLGSFGDVSVLSFGRGKGWTGGVGGALLAEAVEHVAAKRSKPVERAWLTVVARRGR